MTIIRFSQPQGGKLKGIASKNSIEFESLISITRLYKLVWIAIPVVLNMPVSCDFFTPAKKIKVSIDICAGYVFDKSQTAHWKTT